MYNANARGQVKVSVCVCGGGEGVQSISLRDFQVYLFMPMQSTGFLHHTKYAVGVDKIYGKSHNFVNLSF